MDHGLRGEAAGLHRQVGALAMHRVREHRGVTADQVARPAYLRDASVSAFRDKMCEVLDRLRSAEQGLDRGVLLEVLHQIVGGPQGLVELTEQGAADDRERVPVRVDEHEAGHSHRRVAEALDGATLTGFAVEALLDEPGIELHDLLDGHRDLVLPELAAQGLALDEGRLEQARTQPDAFADDGHVGVDVVAATRADTYDTAVPGDETVDDSLGDDHRAPLLSLLCEPGVELRAQHRIGMRMGAVADVLVVETDRGVRGHQPAPLVDDRALEGGLLPVLAYDLFQVVVVEDASHDILRARLDPALEQRNL